MIEETALVNSVNGSLINVVTVQSSACHQCNESTTCSTSVLSKFFGNKEIELQLESELIRLMVLLLMLLRCKAPLAINVMNRLVARPLCFQSFLVIKRLNYS